MKRGAGTWLNLLAAAAVAFLLPGAAEKSPFSGSIATEGGAPTARFHAGGRKAEVAVPPSCAGKGCHLPASHRRGTGAAFLNMHEEDCTEGRQFEDQIACFSFIDNGQYLVKDAGAYGLPYRALIPRGLDNVLIAGRMMTVDLVAHNSTRNTVCCLLCGQAAGTAAAESLASNADVRAVRVTSLQATLERNGAILNPEF